MKTNLGAASPHLPARTLRRARTLISLTALTAAAAGVVLMSGCTLDPPGPSPIYSRLPADQAGATATVAPQQQAAPALTPEQLQRYDAIDQQALAESNRAANAEAAAQAWSRAYTPPVNVYGSYYSGGWGGGWGTGIGYGYPGWGWGW
ncbi:hypothetical protein [Paraburkholderia tropica]|uniref:hypothetical protein n=1 Tax=Paraburkholderia tropica TaxID=92647 RepID=UPI003C6DE252